MNSDQQCQTSRSSRRFSSKFLKSWDEACKFQRMHYDDVDNLVNEADIFFHQKVHLELLEEEVKIIKEQAIEAATSDIDVFMNFRRLVNLMKKAENRTSSMLAEKVPRVVQTSV